MKNLCPKINIIDFVNRGVNLIKPEGSVYDNLKLLPYEKIHREHKNNLDETYEYDLGSVKLTMDIVTHDFKGLMPNLMKNKMQEINKYIYLEQSMNEPKGIDFALKSTKRFKSKK